MCIIAVSKKGCKQPTLEQIKQMYTNNPDGAGFMYASGGVVHIEKGFMTQKSFIEAVKAHHFTDADAVVYHFRISTQAGVKQTMTHPFPLTTHKEYCERLNCIASVGCAHNGIIFMTSSTKETRFSDTALFITDYMTKLIRKKGDMRDTAILNMIDHLTNSKWALMDGTGEIVTVGHFEKEKGGLLFSNNTYHSYDWIITNTPKAGKNAAKQPYTPVTSYVPYKYRAGEISGAKSTGSSINWDAIDWADTDSDWD